MTDIHYQAMANYIIADLIEKANSATDRFQIEALRTEAEGLGLDVDFDSIWQETLQKSVQFHRDLNWFKTFGI
jgi:hypothetical protein